MGYFSFLLIFFITILIHESGHLFACKIYKVPVNEFVIGLGFTLFSFTYKETIFSIKLLPICGYISNGNKNENAKYLKLSLCKKYIIFLSGIFVNILVGILVIGLISDIGFIRSCIDTITIIIPKIVSGIFNVIGFKEFIMKDASISTNISSFLEIAQSKEMNDFKNILKIFGLFNILVGIFNLLPIPILDGGRVIMESIKMLMLKLKVKEIIIDRLEYVLTIGSLVILFVLPNLMDIVRYFIK